VRFILEGINLMSRKCQLPQGNRSFVMDRYHENKTVPFILQNVRKISTNEVSNFRCFLILLLFLEEQWKQCTKPIIPIFLFQLKTASSILITVAKEQPAPTQ